jgi:hypothetical protein
MALDTVAQPEAAPTDSATEVTDAGSQQTDTTDPFAVDESQFVSLSPEQRAALDPVLNKFRESAKTYAQKERETEGKKYTSHIQKAQALEKLVADPRFVKWYQETNNPQQPATPQSVASAEEWAQAYQSLSAGDPMPLEKLQTKLVMAVGGPQLQETQNQMKMLRAENQMNKLWVSHPDAKDLDQIGREEDPEAPSLLQLAAQSTLTQQGVDWERAYTLAKKVALSMENKGKRAAMGMVSEKKGSVTEKPSTNSREEGVQYVDTIEEAMNANIEAAIDGRKVKYQVKK